MGVIQRQSLKYSIVNFVGLGIGTLSTLLVYPLVLEENGLMRFLLDSGMILLPILALGAMPDAHLIAPESRDFDLVVRRALYGKATRWRIYYTVIDEAVQVLHVRHGRRSYLQP